ncbi:MAG: phosphoribosylglycinamide formyltransferase [Parvularcula sp.]
MTRYRTAILLSGSGSNFQALAESAQHTDSFPADIKLVLSNRPDAFGLERAKGFGIKTATLDHKTFSSRQTFDEAIHAELTKNEIEIVLLAGFMRIITAELASLWEGRMLNIHPALLPSFRGNRAHEQVLQSSVTVTGCTVHTVIPEVDAGQIIGQAVVPRLATDGPEALSARVRQAEHLLYPLAVRSYLRGEVTPLTPPQCPDDMLINLNPDARLPQ